MSRGATPPFVFKMAALTRSPFRFKFSSSWILARTFFGSSRDGRKVSQSKVLGDVSAQIYELQIHDVKPKYMNEYLECAEKQFVRLSESKDNPMELVGSWTTEIGNVVDQSIHLWRYKGGYGTMDKAYGQLKTDTEWQDYTNNKLRQQISSRSNQVLVAFTFWDPAALESKEKRGLYELRSYTLKSGAMIEWGHTWMQGIKFRGKEEAVGGWFSQIGEMHVAHHLWGYKNFVERQETRQMAWHLPGWDECVLRTVPLIRAMETKILLPTPFSPLQ